MKGAAGLAGAAGSAAPSPRWAAPAMLLAGVLQTASFAPTEAWYLQILALAALAWATAWAGPRRAAWLGWCFGVGWLVSGLWWLYISMHDFGGMPAPLAGLAVVLLAAALSLYFALAMALFAALRRGTPLADGLLFAACWLLAELARGQWLTGFPWIASGYAHTTGPLAGLAPWVGVYGIGTVAALLGAALAQFARSARPGRRRWPLAALALAVPLAAALLPAEFTTSTGSLRVSLLQPNVAQDLKFDADRIAANMAELQERLHAARGELVVTPESVVPLPRSQLDPAYWAQLTAPFRGGPRAALIGLFLGDETVGYTNSMVGISAHPGAGGDYEYGKRHLLPFGEVIPPGFRWFVELMQIPLGDQEHGSNTTTFNAAGQRLRPLICYEDLFGEDFAASMVGPDAATVLVNASNLAWFGRWMIQDQHLQFSRMRSLEFQRPLVRSTNTGSTAAVDHHGRVTARLAPLVAGTLEASVEGRSGATPYARWLARWGLWPCWAAALAVLALLGAARWQRRRA
ncbi:MAG TPA: apolipoprotein N-acyltransferase [Ideonella sp.]|uniref:apolipoprotein N-acyltransferase n=1 Tax=Ideonella sp. TaxID=1929293 RepID=UPI002BD9F61C|nr:apolipoprotein N-acyltransferase [Ideonella sp.]HSI51577.1 apolipoprotein N-acyltransferase [Ideonella sp.]